MKNKSILFSLVVVVLFIGIVFYVVNNKKEVTENKDDVSQIATGDVTVNVQPQTEQTDASKPMDKISKNGDVLTMNYTGRLTNGTVFDSNVDPKFKHVEPFTFTLGAHDVIAGWDEGLVGMKVGDKKTLTITPDKGYGSRAVGPIPANSTLIFDVEVVAIN